MPGREPDCSDTALGSVEELPNCKTAHMRNNHALTSWLAMYISQLFNYHRISGSGLDSPLTLGYANITDYIPGQLRA